MEVNNELFLILLNFTAVKKTVPKLRKAHCSPPLVGEDDSMVFTSHSVPFPTTHDLQSLVAGNNISRERQKPFHFLHTSDGKQILISFPFGWK